MINSRSFQQRSTFTILFVADSYNSLAKSYDCKYRPNEIIMTIAALGNKLASVTWLSEDRSSVIYIIIFIMSVVCLTHESSLIQIRSRWRDSERNIIPFLKVIWISSRVNIICFTRSPNSVTQHSAILLRVI